MGVRRMLQEIIYNLCDNAIKYNKEHGWVKVVVDADHINSVRLVNLDEATAAMYPLMEPTVEEISNRLASGLTPDEITLSENSKYTQTLLLNSIRATLEKATVSP